MTKYKEINLSKDDITLDILERIDKYYDIYGIEDTGELTIYEYPYLEEGKSYDITCKHGVFLRGSRGLKRISKIIHDIYKRLQEETKDYSNTILTRGWELDIINLLKYRRTVDIEEFDKLISGHETILFRNGKILIDFPIDKTILPYFPPKDNPFKSFQQLPIKYDKDAKCPKIDKFLKETFGEERFTFIYEIIGYLMSSSIAHQKAFIFYGEASTGKTTFMELLTRFIGKDLISNISLHGLGERFALGRTRDKRVNIYDDLSFAKIKNNSYGNFKQLVTNKSLSSEMKFINEPVEWDNTCKCVFGCNQLPFAPYYADSDFYRRMILVPCRNVVKDKNKNILAELTTEEELSGLLNRALNGLAVLYGAGGFPEEWDNIETVRNIWELNSKPSKMFIDEECYFDENASIDIDMFNMVLGKFRHDHNAIKSSDRQIATSLWPYTKSKKPSITISRKQKNGIKYRTYVGIDIDKNSDYYQYKDSSYELYKPELNGQINLDKILVGKEYVPSEEQLRTAKEIESMFVEDIPNKKIYDTQGNEINFGVEG